MAASSSQQSNMPTLNGPLSLSLAKLSFCTTPIYQKRLQWEHLHRKNAMLAVFDTVRSRGSDGVIVEDRVLKLVVSNFLMEQISFNSLSLQAQLDHASNGVPEHTEENIRVRIIVKKPLIAVRYRLPDGHIRRIQMNFQPETGYNLAKELFELHNLPVQNQDNLLSGHPTQPIYTSFSQPSGSQPSISARSTPCLNRPPSSLDQMLITSSPHKAYQGSSQSLTNPAGTPTGLVRPSTAYSEGSFPQSLALISALGAVSSNSRGNAEPLNFINPPMTPADKAQSPLDHGMLESAYNPKVLGPDRGIQGMNSTIVDRNCIFPTIRPASAPETQSERLLTESVPLSQMLPPERTLPFPKENVPTKQISQARDISDEGGQQDEENPKTVDRARKADAQKATTSKTKAKAPSKARTRTRPPASKPPAKKAALESNAGSVKEKTPIAVIAAANDPPTTSKIPKPPQKKPLVRNISPFEDEDPQPAPKLPTPSAQEKVEQTPAKKRRTQKTSVKKIPDEAVAASDPQPPPQVPEASKPSEAKQLPNLANYRPEEYLSSIDNWIRKYHDMPAPQAPPPSSLSAQPHSVRQQQQQQQQQQERQTAKDVLTEYAAQSEEERAKQIENLICECFEDENFVTLVKDVENSWMRIGLGF